VDEVPDWALEGRRGYRAMISQIDHHLGRIIACLEDRGWLDNTVIVYTADHGEMAGDHGRFGKTCFYESSVRVPLYLVGPGIQPGQASSALVELLDVGKTLCELCAVEPHALDQGQSLAPVLRGDRAGRQAVRDTVYAEMGCDKMLYDGRHKLMWGDPASDTRKLGRLHLDKPVDIAPSPPRLYDLETDPCELEDLAQDLANKNLLLAMAEKLLVRLNQNSQPQPIKSRGEYRPLS
jgi:arylsulfatase A-like enzyme